MMASDRAQRSMARTAKKSEGRLIESIAEWKQKRNLKIKKNAIRIVKMARAKARGENFKVYMKRRRTRSFEGFLYNYEFNFEILDIKDYIIILQDAFLRGDNRVVKFIFQNDLLPEEGMDIWFNEIFWGGNRNRFGIVKERLAYQHEGISLIDNYWKDSQ